MRTCNWKSEETSLLHPIASSVPFVEDVRERESVALTGCLPCGYMVTGGMLAVGLMANALTLRTPASPLHHGTEPQIELGNQALFFPSRRRLSVHPTRGSSKKRYPYSHLDWIPPKNSLTSHSVTVRLLVRQIRREGAVRPAVPGLVLLQMSPTSYKNKHVSPFESHNLVTVPQNYRASLLRSKKAGRRKNGLCF